MKNQFAGFLLFEDLGGVPYKGHEANWNVEPGEEWKLNGRSTYFSVECCVQLPLENEPRKLCGAANGKLDALESLRKCIIGALAMSECVHYFPERSLRDHLDSQEYLDGLKKHGLHETDLPRR